MRVPTTDSLAWVGNEPWHTVTDVAFADDEDWIRRLDTLGKLDATLLPLLEAALGKNGASNP